MPNTNNEAPSSLLSQVNEANPVPCFVIDSDHRVVSWNRACELILGISAEEMIGSTDQWKAFYPSRRPTLADLIVDGHIDDTGKVLYGSKQLRVSSIVPNAFEAEDFFPHMGPHGRWLFFTAVPVYEPSGKIIGAVETLQDITLQREAEAELRESHASLAQQVAERTRELAEANHQLEDHLKKVEEISHAKTVFLDTVSHELRTPLNSIIGFAEMIGMDPASETTAEFADYIKTSGNHLKDIVDRIIDFTEIESGKAQQVLSPCGVHELMTMVSRRFDSAASERGILLRTEISEDVPQIITTDTNRFCSIVGELVSNSIKFIDKNDGLVGLNVTADNSNLIVRVADNGPGIPAESTETIFDVFQQVDGSRVRRQDGLGFGLPLARAQAKLLGGTLDFVSGSEACGAVFQLNLPLTLNSALEE